MNKSIAPAANESVLAFKKSPMRHRARPGSGFTLVELLVVAGTVLILLSLAVPAFHTIHQASQLSRATVEIGAALEEARAHAMAAGTHVFVGIQEVDAGIPADGDQPQKPGRGRVVLGVFASRDGTRGYDPYNPHTTWEAAYRDTRGSNLELLGNLRRFENLHMAASLGAPPPGGPMGLDSGRQDVGRFYRLGHPACRSVTPITYPAGTSPDEAGNRFYFQKVIQFDPAGVARIQFATNGEEIKDWMEIGLLATHGGTLGEDDLDAARGNHAAIQLDCMTGSIRIFRP